MFNIFICEDDSKQLAEIERIIDKYLMLNDLDIHLALSTNSPAEMLKHLKLLGGGKAASIF